MNLLVRRLLNADSRASEEFAVLYPRIPGHLADGHLTDGTFGRSYNFRLLSFNFEISIRLITIFQNLSKNAA